MHATKAAVEEGIVPRGGVALLRTQKSLEALKAEGDMQIGVNIVKRAVEEPMRQIASNAGWEGSIVVEKVKEMKQDMGFNALNEKYEDMIKSGILDPTKVVRRRAPEYFVLRWGVHAPFSKGLAKPSARDSFPGNDELDS